MSEIIRTVKSSMDVFFSNYIKKQINLSNVSTKKYTYLLILSSFALFTALSYINILNFELISFRIGLDIFIIKNNNKELLVNVYKIESLLTSISLISIIVHGIYGIFFDLGTFYFLIKIRNTILLMSILDFVFKNRTIVSIFILSSALMIKILLFELFVFMTLPFVDQNSLVLYTEKIYSLIKDFIHNIIDRIFEPLSRPNNTLNRPFEDLSFIYQNIRPNFVINTEREKEYIRSLPTIESDEEFTCSICQNVNEHDLDIVSLRCGHKFHRSCILQSVETGNISCPNCREPIYI